MPSWTENGDGEVAMQLSTTLGVGKNLGGGGLSGPSQVVEKVLGLRSPVQLASLGYYDARDPRREHFFEITSQT